MAFDRLSPNGNQEFIGRIKRAAGQKI